MDKDSLIPQILRINNNVDLFNQIVDSDKINNNYNDENAKNIISSYIIKNLK